MIKVIPTEIKPSFYSLENDVYGTQKIEGEKSWEYGQFRSLTGPFSGVPEAEGRQQALSGDLTQYKGYMAGTTPVVVGSGKALPVSLSPASLNVLSGPATGLPGSFLEWQHLIPTLHAKDPEGAFKRNPQVIHMHLV